MKKLVITAACAMASLAAFGQATISFNSTIGGTAGVAPDNTIFLPGGTVGADAPYQAELAVGTGTSLSSLTLLPSSITSMSGGGGYIFGNGSITINSTTPTGSTVAFDVLVWNPLNGSTYAAAAATPGAIIGSSGVVQGYVTGGPNASGPPNIAPNPAFSSFTLAPVISPEPTTLALGAMGLGAALLFRRRK
jgi:MYXO-CTERM domain-containing protein